MDKEEEQPEEMSGRPKILREDTPKQNAIPSALEGQLKMLADLGDQIDRLINILEPVLSPPTPTDPDKSETMPRPDSLVGTIQERTNTIRKYKENISDLINRIEL